MDPKPHAVCIPAPAQGHIKPMLQLAKLLYHRGFHITFVNTESIHRSLLQSQGPNSLDGLPDFRFEALPEDFSSSGHRPGSVNTQRSLAPFQDLLAKLNDTATSNVPPVSCIVADGYTFFALTVAQQLALPVALFFTCSASSFMGMKYFSALRDKGFTPLKDESYLENGNLDTIIDWIPGLKDICLRDLSSFVRTLDPNDPVFKICIESVERASQASAIVLHTFSALEEDVLDALSSMFPSVHAIGPLQLFLNNLPAHPLKSIGHSMWKEDMECLRWLDSRPPSSVVYVNFGSMAVLTPEQVIEFGWGLASSKHPFLWIIRPDLVAGGKAVLPPKFAAETKGRGMVTSWCPQEQVLNHNSVGGFLTHCGWNSTIESVSAGVPMLCWPFFADQYTSCRFACKEWGVGMEIDNCVERGQVEKLVRELMEGEKGKEMKVKAMEWKGKAEEATTGVQGSSSTALDKLVDVLLSKAPK